MLIVVLMLSFAAGYVTVAALRRPDEPWRRRELFFSGLIGLALTSWLGQTLADAGIFHLLLLLSALLGYTAIVGLRARGRIVPRGLELPRHDLLPLGVILLIGAALFFPPAETPIGGRDDGIRLMAGATVAQHGGWLRSATLLPSLALYRGFEGDLEHIGFLVWDEARGLVVPQFTGAHEVWQAIAWGWPSGDLLAAGGVRAAHPWMFWLNPLLALGGLLACYALGRIALGRPAGTIGALLLAINIAQVWYARQTMGEILLQTMLLGGLAATIAYLQRPDRVSALAAGLALGVALLTKVDAIIAIGALGLVAILAWPRRRAWPHLAWLIVPLLLLFAHYAAHGLWFSGDYFSDNIGNQLLDRTLVYAVLTGSAALIGLFVVWLLFRARLRAMLLWSPPRGLRLAAVAALAILALYGYFLRPTVLADERYFHSVWQDIFYTYRGLNVVMLISYMTPLAAGLALFGLLLIAPQLRWHQLPLIVVGLAYTLLFSYNAMIAGDQPFWVRRFLPVAIPAALLLCGAALGMLWQRRDTLRWIAPAALAALIGWNLWNTAPVAAIRSGAGTSAQVAQLAATIPPNAVVLFENWPAAFSVAAPLEVLYGRESHELTGEPLSGGDAQRWIDQLDAWQREGRPLIYIGTSGGLTIPAGRFRWQPIGTTGLRYTTLGSTHDRLPWQPFTADQRLDVWQIVPATGQTAESCAANVEIGGADYGAIGTGFYASERVGNLEARWTTEQAALVLPPLSGDGDATLRLWISDARPAEAGAANLRVVSGDRTLADLLLRAGWNEYAVTIPASLLSGAQPQLIDLQIPAWSPQDFGKPDGRKLGVMIDRFELRRDGCTQ